MSLTKVLIRDIVESFLQTEIPGTNLPVLTYQFKEYASQCPFNIHSLLAGYLLAFNIPESWISFHEWIEVPEYKRSFDTLGSFIYRPFMIVDNWIIDLSLRSNGSFVEFPFIRSVKSMEGYPISLYSTCSLGISESIIKRKLKTLSHHDACKSFFSYANDHNHSRDHIVFPSAESHINWCHLIYNRYHENLSR